MFLDFLGKWKSGSGFTSAELQVIRALLSSENQNAEKLIEQAVGASNISRRVNGPGFEARIPFVVDSENLIECEREISSPVLAVSVGHQNLLFSTKILRGGFLMGLAGSTADGSPWPRRWERNFVLNGLGTNIPEWIPRPMQGHVKEEILRDLLDWAQVDRNKMSLEIIERIRLRPPVTEQAVMAREMDLGSKLGPLLREFYQITNGFSVYLAKAYDVYSLAELSVIEKHPLSVVLTDLFEEGQIRLVSERDNFSDECFWTKPDGKISRIGNVRDHVRDSLLWNA